MKPPIASTGRRTPWTRDEAIAAVKAFHERNGYQPVSSEAGSANDLPSFNVATRLFGSWNGMIQAAGFRPYPSRASGPAKTRAFRDRNPNWRETAVRRAQETRIA